MKLEQADWEKLWRRIGAAGDPGGHFSRIVTAYKEAHRFYHNSEHIAECLKELREVDGTIEAARDEIEMALWLHDVVYDPKRSDNEERSATVAREICGEGNLPEEFIRKVEGLILATRHNATPTDRDAQLMLDIDLSILGKGEDRFWRYERDVRREYAFVPEEIFRAKRAEILETFLKRDRIFNTARFEERYGKQARRNLEESIRRRRS
jgi:predicted metal-dependent HD superfamily phosphohydrolase